MALEVNGETVDVSGLSTTTRIQRRGGSWEVELEGRRVWVTPLEDGNWAVTEAGGGRCVVTRVDHTEVGVSAGPVKSPLAGVVTAVSIAVGDRMTAGQELVVVEAMKMRYPVTAKQDGIVVALHVSLGDRVGLGQVLLASQPL